MPGGNNEGKWASKESKSGRVGGKHTEILSGLLLIRLIALLTREQACKRERERHYTDSPRAKLGLVSGGPERYAAREESKVQ